MSNIIHCPECRAPCQKKENPADGRPQLQAFSLIQAAAKIEQLKMKIQSLTTELRMLQKKEVGN